METPKSEDYLSTIRQQMETLSAQWAPKSRPLIASADCNPLRGAFAPFV
jgi:hypothetical protein